MYGLRVDLHQHGFRVCFHSVSRTPVSQQDIVADPVAVRITGVLQHVTAVEADEQVVFDAVVAGAQARIVRLLPEAGAMAVIRAEDIVAHYRISDGCEIGPDIAVVEVVAFHQGKFSDPLPQPVQCTAIAAGIVIGDIVFGAGAFRVGIDLKVGIRIVVQFIVAHDEPVSSIRQVDTVSIAFTGMMGDITIDHDPASVSSAS